MMAAQTNWADKLRNVRANASARVAKPAEWKDVTGRAVRARAGSAMLRSGGQIADELHDAAIDNLPHEIADALHRVAPDFDLGTLKSFPQEALDGLANLLKGSLFELRVADGISDGSIPLPDSAASFHLADNFDTPGFDGSLLDSHGQVIELVQLKASSHFAIIREALRKWPGIDHFMTTSEAATDAARHGIPHVIDTGITDAALSAEVHGALADQVTTSFGEVFDEIIPQFTLVIIAAQAVRMLSNGKSPEEVREWARKRATGATITSAVAGAASMATGTDAVRIPAVFATLMVRSIVAEIDRSADSVRRVRNVASQLVTKP